MRRVEMGAARRAGVGLVEMVIAAVILAGSLAVVFQMLGVGVRGTEQVGDELAGAQAASDLLDGIASVPPHRLTSTAGDVPLSALAVAGLERFELPAGCTATVGIDALPATSEGIAAGRCKRIRVQVRWTASGHARNVSLARLVIDDAGLER